MMGTATRIPIGICVSDKVGAYSMNDGDCDRNFTSVRYHTKGRSVFHE